MVSRKTTSGGGGGGGGGGGFNKFDWRKTSALILMQLEITNICSVRIAASPISTF